jgi:HD-GYP domain-containing protein (c-di-GMP phosphodiesterase class II)
MISDRPYRDGMSIEEACEELERCAGSQFDPAIVSAFAEELALSATASALPAAALAS